MKNKLIWLLGLSVVLTACDVDNTLDPIEGEVISNVALSASGLDFSKYVSVGASFTAGFTDGALFKASQENSFPNLLSKKFAMANGGAFTQPLMNDNIGGFLIGGVKRANPRFWFNGSAPVILNAIPTTEIAAIQAGPYNNMGIPGIKSYHLDVVGYGALAALPNANPYFVRMASNPGKSVLEDAVDQNPTFFTLSEIGGNDVLGYSIAGGDGVDRTGDINAAAYGPNDITDPNVFAAKFSKAVTELTKNGAKGVVTTVPYVTSLPYFTTVPHNAIPLDGATATQLNAAFAAYNKGLQDLLNAKLANLLPAQVLPLLVNYDQAEVDRRKINFVAGQNAVLILDESLSNLTPINPRLTNMRQATSKDLLVLPSSSFLGTTVGGNPQFINGVSVPLADKWVLTEDEISKVKTATDSYNNIINAVASSKNLAVVDFKAILEQASTTGISSGNFVLTTQFVTGGLVSLDGVHLTARGYAVLANKVLEAIDKAYGSNFTKATNGLIDAGNYPTNYSPALR